MLLDFLNELTEQALDKQTSTKSCADYSSDKVQTISSIIIYFVLWYCQADMTCISLNNKTNLIRFMTKT